MRKLLIFNFLFLSFFASLASETPSLADEIISELNTIMAEMEKADQSGNVKGNYVFYDSKYQEKKIVKAKNKTLFSEKAISDANGWLYKLDSIDRKTIIFFKHKWYSKKEKHLDKNKKEKSFKLIMAETIAELNASKRTELKNGNINILINIMLFAQDTADVGATWKYDIYSDYFQVGSELEESCNKSVQGHINGTVNAKQHLFSKNPDDALVWRSNLLWEKVRNCKKIEIPKEIIIFMNRTKSNDYRSISSFKLNYGKKTGFILERPKGTEVETKKSGSKKRIASGTYTFQLHTASGNADYVNTTYLLNNVPGRGGILMHWGNESDDSNGCLLINRKDPSGDTYTKCCKPDNSPKANDYWTDSMDFMGELIDEVNSIEKIIKETYQDIKVVPKKIVIDESSEIIN